MNLKRVSLRSALLFALFPLSGAAIAIAVQVQPASPSSGIETDRLKALGVLTDDEVWTAERLPKRQPLSIPVDIDGDGSEELLVAGIVSSPRDPSGSPDHLQGFVKFFREYPPHNFQLIWETTVPNVQYLTHLQKARLDRTKADKVFIRFGCVSNYDLTRNLVFFWGGDGYARLEFPTHWGGAKLEDLNKDGIDELISHTTLNREAPAPQRVLWFDVYSWRGFGFQPVSSDFPNFYRDLIKDYYEPRLEKELSRKTPEPYLRGYREAITRARELAKGR